MPLHPPFKGSSTGQQALGRCLGGFVSSGFTVVFSSFLEFASGLMIFFFGLWCVFWLLGILQCYIIFVCITGIEIFLAGLRWVVYLLFCQFFLQWAALVCLPIYSIATTERQRNLKVFFFFFRFCKKWFLAYEKIVQRL